MLNKLFRQNFRWFFLYFLIAVGTIIADSVAIVLFQRLLDTIGILQDLPQGLQICLGLLAGYGVLLFLKYLGGYLMSWPLERLQQSLPYGVKQMVLEKMERIDYQASAGLGLGSLIQRVENGAGAARGILLGFWLYIFSGLIPTILITLLFIGFYDVSVFVYIIIGYIVVYIFTKLLMKRLLFIKDQLLEQSELLNNRLVRGLMEALTFRVLRRSRAEAAACAGEVERIVGGRVQLTMLHELFFAAFVVLVLGVKLAVMAGGIVQISQGSTAYTVGSIVALISFIDKLYQPIADFNIKLVDYRLNHPAVRRVQEILDAPQIPNLDSGTPFCLTAGHIEAHGLRYYIGEARLLNGFDCSIPGGRTAIVGPSGSGKSTFLRVLTGICQGYSGSVSIDGQEVSGMRLYDLYGSVHILSQETPVFSGTVRENLAPIGSFSDEQLYAVLEKVDLADLVCGWPLGLDEPIGERGIRLSGGERQRLALARVFLDRRGLVLLDESTSNIDTALERRIFSELFAQGCAVVSVMHRLSCVGNFDRIIVVDAGQVTGSGSFEELLQDNSVFQGLWEASQKGEKDR